MKEIKKRQINSYRIQLAIVQNPHTKNPKALWEQFNEEEPIPRKESFDATGFERFKDALSANRKFIVK